MNKQHFEEYAALKKEEKRIKARIDMLNPLVKKEMQEAEADKVSSEYGTFVLKPVPVYAYSKAVEIALGKVDELKEDEKARGIAKANIRYDLVYTSATKKEA